MNNQEILLKVLTGKEKRTRITLMIDTTIKNEMLKEAKQMSINISDLLNFALYPRYFDTKGSDK